MTDFLIDIDTRVFMFLHGPHTLWLDYFMSTFSGRFEWIALYVVIAYAIFKTFGRSLGIAYLLAIAAAITLTDQTCASLIRPMVERMRPSNPANPLSEMVTVVNNYRGGAFGFPSCHAANTFALATFVAMMFRRRRVGWSMFAWAILTCYSRVYLGVHYPGDLLSGAIVGSLFGLLCFACATVGFRSLRARGLQMAGRPVFHLGSDPNGRGQGITCGDLILATLIATVIAIAIYATLYSINL